ncbi:hypothetical protein F5890DRAFT_1588834 [Lentinula detonsa]|uniref:Uncharacterized protein n=1 Tax=Lentinula detonsa TaxID=2804962 RepID=A0AA38PRR2_9AGAR|nr:hypothetical protein F5890DRAFT_1588834 [Lentinula detonsa]
MPLTQNSHQNARVKFQHLVSHAVVSSRGNRTGPNRNSTRVFSDCPQIQSLTDFSQDMMLFQTCELGGKNTAKNYAPQQIVTGGRQWLIAAFYWQIAGPSKGMKPMSHNDSSRTNKQGVLPPLRHLASRSSSRSTASQGCPESRELFQYDDITPQISSGVIDQPLFTLGKTSTAIAVDLDMPWQVVQWVLQTGKILEIFVERDEEKESYRS